MRRIGAHVSSAGGIQNAVTNTINIGANAMQIFAGSPRMWRRSLYKEKDTENFKKQVADNNLRPVFIHALYLTNLASDNPETRAKSKSALITDMTNSAAIDSSGVILHIGSHQGRGFESVRDLVVSEISEVLDQTPGNSSLLLENVAGQRGKIGSLEELSILLEALDSHRVGVCIDTAHAFEAGYKIHDPAGLDSFVADLSSLIGIEPIKLFHLNDSRTDFNSRHDVHENIGEGKIGITNIARIVNHPKLSSLPLILEVPGFDGSGPDKRNIDIVKSLLE